MIQEGVTQGDPLSMVLHRITLLPLAEYLREADPGILYPFYSDDAAFDGSARRSLHLLNLIMERGLDRGYLAEPDKSIFIADSLEQ